MDTRKERVKVLQLIILSILTVACCVAALFLYLQWSVKSVTAVAPVVTGNYTLEVLAINITILEIVLALVGFVVAVMGFFGYAGIKAAAIDAAEKEARKVADEQMRLYKRSQEGTKSGPEEYSGDFSTADVSVDEAEPVSEGE